MNRKCINATKHCQNILHGDTFHNMKTMKYKTVCEEFPFATHHRQNRHDIFMEFVIFALCAMQLDYCNIQRVCDQRYIVGTPTVYIVILSFISMPQNCMRSGKNCHIYNVFKFRGTFSN